MDPWRSTIFALPKAVYHPPLIRELGERGRSVIVSSWHGKEEATSAIISPLLSPPLKRDISAEAGGFAQTATYR